MSQGVDILKTAPSALPPIPLSLNDPQFETSRRRAGLPGKVLASILCPFTPPVKFWRDGARSGQGFGGETTSIQLRPKLRGYSTLLLGNPFKVSADTIMKRMDVNGSS